MPLSRKRLAWDLIQTGLGLVPLALIVVGVEKLSHIAGVLIRQHWRIHYASDFGALVASLFLILGTLAVLLVVDYFMRRALRLESGPVERLVSALWLSALTIALVILGAYEARG